MLKQRILTAIILIPIFIFLVLKLSEPAFYIMTAMIVVWGAWEWSLFMGVAKFPQCFLYPVAMIFLLLASLAIPIQIILYAAFIWWLVALVLVCTYPKASSAWSKSVTLRALMGVFVLVPCWRSINFIHGGNTGAYTLLFLFVLIWGADTGAYFAGRKWGKNKLAPMVSPGKTWQGLIGALLLTLCIVFASFYLFSIPHRIWAGVVVLCLITVLFSVLGDLLESMLKRNVGLKDSGQLLPGHGGILDRVDSLTAAAPIFALGLILMQEFFH